MKFTTPFTLALITVGMSVTAQSIAEAEACIVADCTAMIDLATTCGVDFTSSYSTSTASESQRQCICNGQNASNTIQTCLNCLEKSNLLDDNTDEFRELCPSATGAGARFGSAPYVLGGVVAGVGILGMA